MQREDALDRAFAAQMNGAGNGLDDVPHPADQYDDGNKFVSSLVRQGTPRLPDGYRIWTPEPPKRPELDADGYHGPIGDFLRHVSDNSEADPVGVGINLLAFIGVMLKRDVSFRAGKAVQHFPHIWAVVVGGTSSGGKGVASETADLVLAAIDPNPAQWEMSGIGSGQHFIDRISERPQALVREHELGSVLKTCDRQGETLGTTLRNAYDGKPLRAGSRGSGESEASGYSVGALGSITPEEYRELTTSLSISDGSANRWLPVWVRIDTENLMPFGDTINHNVVTSTARAITAGTAQAVGTDYIIEPGTPAGELWVEFYKEHRIGNGDSGLLNSFMARHVPHAARLAIIFAAVDGSSSLLPEHLRAAFAWCKYSADTLRTVFPQNVTGDQAKLLEIIRSAGAEGITEKEQTEALHRNVPDLRAIRQQLAENKQICAVQEKPEGVGRPTKRWFAIAPNKPTNELTN